MGMVVRTNTMALNAYRQLGMNNNAVSKSLEKLSSGFRINRAADDAAGLAISEKMKAQIKGLETASSNAQDGISLLQTAEGNLSEVHNMLNRMVELATKSANGTYTSTEREALQDEVDQLLEEIDRISQSANFNGTRLLDGSLSNGGGGKVYAGMDRIIKDVLGSDEDAIANTGIKTILDNASGSTAAKNTVFDVDFTGLTGGAGNAANKATVTTVDGTAAGAAGTAPTVTGNPTVTGSEGVAATPAAAKVEIDLTGVSLSGAGSLKLTVGGVDITSAEIADADKADASKIAAAFNGKTATFGAAGAFTATVAGNKVTFTQNTPADTTNVAAINSATTAGVGPAGAAATNGTATVDLTGKTGKELIGSTVTIGDKTYEFIKTGGTATTGNTAVSIAENADAAAIATALNTAAGAAKPTDVGTVALDGTTKVKFTRNDTAGAASKFDKAESAASTNNTFDFEIGGVKLADDVLVAKDATAADIAQKVLDKIAGADNARTADVKIGEINYTVTKGTSGLTFTLKDPPTADNIAGNYDWDITDIKGEIKGNHTAGTLVKTPGVVANSGQMANTVFRIDASDIKDGTTITVDKYTVTLAVGNGSKQDTTDASVIDLKNFEEGSITKDDMDKILSAISKGFTGKTDNFIVGTNNTGNGDVQKGLTVHKREGNDHGTYDTIGKLAEIFELKTGGAGSALTLQIGDTAEDFNKMSVSIGDMSAQGLKINGLDITTETDASNAIEKIKTAINTVSSTRAGMGALQNRLEYTINNLDVAVENLSAANSRIRDTDMAKEMMNYTKMNVLVQSAQAMLAQANQQPQSVLQLLQ